KRSVDVANDFEIFLFAHRPSPAAIDRRVEDSARRGEKISLVNATLQSVYDRYKDSAPARASWSEVPRSVAGADLWTHFAPEPATRATQTAARCRCPGRPPLPEAA